MLHGLGLTVERRHGFVRTAVDMFLDSGKTNKTAYEVFGEDFKRFCTGNAIAQKRFAGVPQEWRKAKRARR
jgi:hypothetical protein